MKKEDFIKAVYQEFPSAFLDKSIIEASNLFINRNRILYFESRKENNTAYIRFFVLEDAGVYKRERAYITTEELFFNN